MVEKLWWQSLRRVEVPVEPESLVEKLIYIGRKLTKSLRRFLRRLRKSIYNRSVIEEVFDFDTWEAEADPDLMFAYTDGREIVYYVGMISDDFYEWINMITHEWLHVIIPRVYGRWFMSESLVEKLVKFSELEDRNL